MFPQLLNEIDENATMVDFIKNLINNINIYLEHLDIFKKLRYTEEFLMKYRESLYKMCEMIHIGEAPDWFTAIKPYRLTSAMFPYVSPFFEWNFSFKDMVDIALGNYVCDSINDYSLNVLGDKLVEVKMVSDGKVTSEILSKDEFFKKFKLKKYGG